jgi:hypothetical protein
MAEPVVDLFAEHGFVEWGGYWRNPIDYQHVQVGRKLAARLARLPAAEARALFERFAEKSRACVAASVSRGEPNRRSCIGDPWSGPVGWAKARACAPCPRGSTWERRGHGAQCRCSN